MGTQDYKGLKLSFQRRAAAGVSLSGNYTVSRCFGDPALQTGGFPQIANGYTNPDDLTFDRGLCDQDRTHLGIFVAAYDAAVRHSALRAAFSDWRISGILSARSGQPLNVIAGQDRAFSGIQNQRVDQVLDNPYGSKKTPNDWLNPAAFALPAPGTLGNFRRNSVRAPGYWSVDVALSRLVPFGAAGRWSSASRRSTCSTRSTGARRSPVRSRAGGLPIRISVRRRSAGSRRSRARRASCSSA